MPIVAQHDTAPFHRRQQASAFTTLVLGASVILCISCRAKTHGFREDSGVDPVVGYDSGPRDASVDGEAPADAWVFATEPCDATFLELPSPQDTLVRDVENWGRWVVYDDRRLPPHREWRSDIYLYDLLTCTEYAVTRDRGTQAVPRIWGKNVVWIDFGPDPLSLDHRTGWLDLESGRKSIQWHPTRKGAAALNHRYVVFYDQRDVDAEARTVLVDRWTGSEMEIQQWWNAAEHFSMSDTHVAWIASCVDCGGVADVFYMNLATKHIVHLRETIPGNQLNTSTWGDYIVWQDDRWGHWTIYAHQISSGRTWQLVTDWRERGLPRLRGHIVAWSSCAYKATYQQCHDEGIDVVLYDLESNVRRRVTNEPGWFIPRYVDGEWLVYVERVLGQDRRIFAKNLVASGALDATGNVVGE